MRGIGNGKVLVSRDVGQTNFDLPGGRLNVGEKLTNGLAREIQEELGVHIEVGRPFFVDTFVMSHSGEPHVLIVYEATVADDAIFNLAPNEIEEVRWIGENEIATTPMWEEYKQTLQVFFNLKK